MVWTSRKLLKRLREILRSEDLTIRLGALHPNISATIAWGSHEPTIVKVDPAQAGIVTCVIHELLHIALLEDLADFDGGDLEEPIIEAVEKKLYDSLTAHQHSWWRSAIRRKLNQAHETEAA